MAINMSDEYSSAALIYSWAHLEELCLFYNWGRAGGGRCAHKYTVHDQHDNMKYTEWVFFSTGSDVHDDVGTLHVQYILFSYGAFLFLLQIWLFLS